MITGTVGFVLAAAAISGFAYTANQAYIVVKPLQRTLFVLAFGLLALSMLFWALTVTFTNSTNSSQLLFTTDALLLAATACMAVILCGQVSAVIVGGLITISAVVLALRAFVYLPTGFVHDGLLYFNLAGGVRLVILLAFVAVWLPALLTITRQLAIDKAFNGLQNSLSSCFVGLVLVTGLFLSARQSKVIISLFILVIGLFLAMSCLNLLVIKLHKQLEDAAHAAHRTK